MMLALVGWPVSHDGFIPVVERLATEREDDCGSNR